MDTRKGVLCALSAYGLWGFLSLYFRMLGNLPAFEVLAHRIIWSFVFTALLLAGTRLRSIIPTLLAQPRILLNLALSSILIAANWVIFIWSVQHHHVLDASLGYYINPLVNVLLGWIVLREKLNRLQWLATAMAAAGVMIQITVLGHFPVISLALALSFGLYGLIRKQTPVDAQTGLFAETLILLLPTLFWIGSAWPGESLNPGHNQLQLNILLMLAGPVTSIPLILFAAAARHLNYSTLGFFQYIAPTIMFILALTVFREPLSPSGIITFACIWTGVVLFSYDAWQRRNRVKSLQRAEQSDS